MKFIPNTGSVTSKKSNVKISVKRGMCDTPTHWICPNKYIVFLFSIQEMDSIYIFFKVSDLVSTYCFSELLWDISKRDSKIYGEMYIHINNTQNCHQWKSMIWSHQVTILQMPNDEVIEWKHFPLYWPFMRGIHRGPVNSPHKGQWRGALLFSLICVWINGWVNNREAGDLRRYRAHYDVSVMLTAKLSLKWTQMNRKNSITAILCSETLCEWILGIIIYVHKYAHYSVILFFWGSIINYHWIHGSVYRYTSMLLYWHWALVWMLLLPWRKCEGKTARYVSRTHQNRDSFIISVMYYPSKPK